MHIIHTIIIITLLCLSGCSTANEDKTGDSDTIQNKSTQNEGTSITDRTDDISAADISASTATTETGHVEKLSPLPAPVLITPPTHIATPPEDHVPTKVKTGMKVAEALKVPGATQTVAAIMTGGKITGTIVIQWNGKSFYTNVDFAQEGGFAYGTRYSTPEEVEAFIEIACSDQAHPSDFTDKAVVTEQIK